MNDNVMEKLVALCKRRGFMYPGSEIYGGLANTYDYGPMGLEVLRNIKNLWWKYFVLERDDMVGLDTSLISHHKVWEASGHVANFADAMVDCKNCKARMRADHLIETYLDVLDPLTRKALVETHTTTEKESLSDVYKAVATGKVEGFSINSLTGIIDYLSIAPPDSLKLTCPNCGKIAWTPVRKFNQLFPVQLGLVEGEEGFGYLRGETAQGIFINFKNVISSTRVKLPFGIAQQGKSFRNEITPGNSIFRTIEFEQGEIEYFFNPYKNAWKILFDSWKKAMMEFVTQRFGVKEENLRWRAHTDEERSFYSKKTEDLEYRFPFGFKELWGLAYRTDYDLIQHQNVSKKDLAIVDPETGKKIMPHVIEPAVGLNRLMLMVLCDAYSEEENRVVLKLHPRLAPVKAAVFPLLRNKPELTAKAEEVYRMVKKSIDGVVQYDDRGNIGKRYLAQDEVGTPFCVTVDFQTLEDGTVTVRERDTMKQERVNNHELLKYLGERL